MMINSDQEYLIGVKYVASEGFHKIILWMNIKFIIPMDYFG